MKIPMHLLQAELTVEKNKDGRFADLKWYTGATIRRMSWDGKYFLTLSMNPEHVRMERLASGKAPLLNSHSDYRLSDVIVVIESADVKGNARVRFSNRPEVDPIWNDVKDGIIRNASVGAAIYKLKDVTEKDDEGNEKTKAYLAVDWEPLEVSLVPIGADPDAGLRAKETISRVTEAEIVSAPTNRADSARMEEANMDNDTPTDAGEDTRKKDTDAAVKAAQEAERQRLIGAGIDAERARVQIINETVKALKLRQIFADQHIKAGTGIEVFRKAAIDEAAEEEKRRTVEIRTPAGDPRLQDEVDARRFGMVGALLERFEQHAWSFDEMSRSFNFHNDRKQKIFEGARHYMGMSLLDVAKECLTLQGIRWQTKSRTEIVSLAFQSTSDFPFILADSASKSLRAGYDMAESQWRLIAARRTAADFKTQAELTLDQSSRLEKVAESGEFTHGKLIEGKETWKLSTYGKIIGITRQAIINDDLGAFTRTPFLMGQEVAMLENDTVVAIISANGNLRDNHEIFNEAYHANVVATSDKGTIDVEGISACRVLLMTQTSPGGKVLGIIPRFLVAPAALATLAEQYCSPAFQAVTSATINPFAGRISPVVLPGLTDDGAWYLFGDPNSPNGTVLIYAYLEGQEGPYTETRQGFEVDGVEIKIRHDFASAAVDYRGAVKNPGA